MMHIIEIISFLRGRKKFAHEFVKEDAVQMPIEMQNIKVSIVIPVYNGADYVREAIDSALSQTYSNLEIIVVNDGSTDDGATEKIALSYGDKITYYRKENGGVSSALNFGIEKMTGDYFSWLSHDDKYEPEKVMNAVAALQANGNDSKLIPLAHGYYINSASEPIEDFPIRFEPNRVYSGEETLSVMLQTGVLNGCCMLIPKTAFETCGGFDEDLRYNQDALMWYKIFASGYKLVFDGKKTVMYRRHEKQASNTRRDLLLHDTEAICDTVLPLFVEHSNGTNNLLYLYAMRNAKYDCRVAVEKCIEAGKEAHLLSSAQILRVRAHLLYGKVRLVLKKIYLKLILKK